MVKSYRSSKKGLRLSWNSLEEMGHGKVRDLSRSTSFIHTRRTVWAKAQGDTN